MRTVLRVLSQLGHHPAEGPAASSFTGYRHAATYAAAAGGPEAGVVSTGASPTAIG